MIKIKKYICDCMVVGGGAAGMMAAIAAAKQGVRVILIEHTQRLGAKILQTGNGKCNFTNMHIDALCYQNKDTEFVMRVLDCFSVKDTLDFFEEIGIYHKEKNGYVYPHSETAASLQTALRYELDKLGVEVFVDTDIISVKKDGDLFCIKTENEIFSCCSCILATGSKAAPKTGSDGTGYAFAKKFGHHIVKPLPALVQLTSDNKFCKVMSGVRSTGKVSVFVNDTCIASDTGEIQYTDYGISGIPVFQVSRHAVCAIDRKHTVKAVIDMLPDFSEDLLVKQSFFRLYNNGSQDIISFFSGLLNKKLVQAAVKSCGYLQDMTAEQIGKRGIANIIRTFKSFSFNITGSRSFDMAQICQGGVSLADVSSQDMQSKKCNGLFFAGELLDVDGKCGGYNLQWAWSSGYLAGSSAAQYSIIRKGRENGSNQSN